MSQTPQWRRIFPTSEMIESSAKLSVVAYLSQQKAIDPSIRGVLKIHRISMSVVNGGDVTIQPVKSALLRVAGLPSFEIDSLEIQTVLNVPKCLRIIPCRNGFVLEFGRYYISALLSQDTIQLTRLDVGNNPVLNSPISDFEREYVLHILEGVRARYNTV
jgi:hypothetical protein